MTNEKGSVPSMSVSSDSEQYKKDRKEELKIIQYINFVWSKGKWDLKQGTFEQDMKGIDAVGFERNTTMQDTELLVQIKCITFNHLPALERLAIVKRVAKNMDLENPNASKRLIVYQKKGKSIRLWNYSIDKILKKH